MPSLLVFNGLAPIDIKVLNCSTFSQRHKMVSPVDPAMFQSILPDWSLFLVTNSNSSGMSSKQNNLGGNWEAPHCSPGLEAKFTGVVSSKCLITSICKGGGGLDFVNSKTPLKLDERFWLRWPRRELFLNGLLLALQVS